MQPSSSPRSQAFLKNLGPGWAGSRGWSAQRPELHETGRWWASGGGLLVRVSPSEPENVLAIQTQVVCPPLRRYERTNFLRRQSKPPNSSRETSSVPFERGAWLTTTLHSPPPLPTSSMPVTSTQRPAPSQTLE